MAFCPEEVLLAKSIQRRIESKGYVVSLDDNSENGEIENEDRDLEEHEQQSWTSMKVHQKHQEAVMVK